MQLSNIVTTLFAVFILIIISLFYFIRIKIRSRRYHNSRNFPKNEPFQESDISQLRAPFRSSSDYNRATQSNKNKLSSFSSSNIENSDESSSGTTLISSYSSSHKYLWDGQALSLLGGNKVLIFDGKYISTHGGSRKFKWENNILSSFAGRNLYSISGNSVSKFAGPKIYTFTGDKFSAFAGSPIYRLEGNLSVPPAVLIIISENLI